MADVQFRTVEEWEQLLGSQVRDLRLRRNITQQRLGELADVSTATVHRLEAGNGSSVATLVKITRALSREEWLTEFAPPAPISPMQMLRERRAAEANRRQRASRSAS